MKLFEIGSLELNKKLIVLAFTLLFLFILLRTAWISDDAAITLRTVLNFLHGFGPTFNIDERVQAYTHPLWFLILSLGSFVSGNVFYTTFFASVIFSIIALGFLLKNASSNYFALVLIGLTAVLSKAFVDFSTSGLENPLSHLLILLAVVSASAYIERGHNKLTVFLLICSGLYLNRPDLLIIIFPLVAYLALAAIRQPKQLAASIFIGVAPVIAWTAFSIFYYGFPLSNTAYAKLGAGIAIDERIIQGFRYLLHSAYKDPVTIFAIVVGIAIGSLGSHFSKSLSIGIMSYLIYILYIGGDFMEGRFLTVPFIMSMILFSREMTAGPFSLALIIIVVILGSASAYPNLLSGSSYSNSMISVNGIADERGFYYQKFGLLTAKRDTFFRPRWELPSERKVDVICGGLGFNSIEQGPGMHYIDNCALADPLLARLPAKENSHWRIGHFYRQLPTDYMESIKQGENLIIDKKTAHYWESIRIVTRGALFEKHRFFEIFKLNLGLIEKPDWEMYRKKNIPRSTAIPVVAEAYVKTIRHEGVSWNAPGNIVFDSVLDISLSEKTDIVSIDISVDNNDVYEIAGFQDREWVQLAEISPKNTSGLARHHIALKATVSGVEKIRVEAKSGDGMYSIGHLLVNGK